MRINLGGGQFIGLNDAAKVLAAKNSETGKVTFFETLMYKIEFKQAIRAGDESKIMEFVKDIWTVRDLNGLVKGRTQGEFKFRKRKFAKVRDALEQLKRDGGVLFKDREMRMKAQQISGKKF
ncbi:MAG: hypothetical protein LW808_002330 [Verrucomicrobiota bacterium]|nr:MAG: hypothetical protein LW808_002330 [Verrucomicrobiota bacterium]